MNMKTKTRWNLILMGFLVATITLLLIPTQAWGMLEGAGMTASTSQELNLMLPAGRWGQQIGSITARTEPADDLLGGFISNIGSSIGVSMRLVLPNMLLMISQMCWSTALSLSQFAASFDPLDEFGSQMDKSIALLVDNIMQGGIPATLVFLGLFGWIGAAAFNWGSSVAAVKRIGATICCLACLTFVGGQAARDGGTEKPVTGSPWWMVTTINDTVNTLAVGLNLDGLHDNDPHMMASETSQQEEGGKTLPNCQTYLYQMHKQYDAAAKRSGKTGSNTSAVTKAVNRMWEETALRSWVTMQYGNPSADGTTTTTQVANNAQQAYCHVLEAYAHTDAGTQKMLTNEAMGTNIDDKTAKYLFNPDLGFIDPWNSKVNDDSKAFDRGTDIYTQRAAVFWETCNTDGSGNIYARKGWSDLINNIGDDNSMEIKGGGGKSLRAARKSGSKLWNVVKDSSSPLLGNAESVCKAVLSGHSAYQGNEGNTPNDGDEGHDYTGMAVGDAATIGWRFDVPNVGNTWREANVPMTNADNLGMSTSLGFMYGNNKIDTLGATGSMLGAVVNMFVWGLLSLFLIVSKLMLVFCTLSLIVAFLVCAFPFGDAPRKVLLKWGKGALNFSMVGILYSILASIATCVCQIIIAGTGMVSNSFFYNLMTGCGPALALVVIALTCGMLGLKNPFSLKAVATMAGSGALYAGLTRAGRMAAYDTIRNARAGRRHKAEDGRASSKANGNGDATESAETIRKATSKPEETPKTTSTESQETPPEKESADTEKPESGEEGGGTVAADTAVPTAVSGDDAEDEDTEAEKPEDGSEGGTVVEEASTKTDDQEAEDGEPDSEEAEESGESGSVASEEEPQTEGLFGGTRWADRDPNTIRGSLGNVSEKTKAAWGRHSQAWHGALAAHAQQEAKRVAELEAKYPGMNRDDIRRHAHRARRLRDFRSTVLYGGGMAFRAASTVAAGTFALARSKPLRQAIKTGVSNTSTFARKAMPVAKTAAKAAVTVAAMTNPVTAGLGVLMAAKMVTNRNNLRNAVTGVQGTYAGVKMGIQGAKHAAVGLSHAPAAVSRIVSSRGGQGVLHAPGKAAAWVGRQAPVQAVVNSDTVQSAGAMASSFGESVAGTLRGTSTEVKEALAGVGGAAGEKLHAAGEAFAGSRVGKMSSEWAGRTRADVSRVVEGFGWHPLKKESPVSSSSSERSSDPRPSTPTSQTPGKASDQHAEASENTPKSQGRESSTQ